MGFTLTHVTWEGPACDDRELLARLPPTLRALLDQTPSGFIQFHGGLHYRGAVRKPGWHSLRSAWLGPKALHKAYPAMKTDDVPFAQDYLGNQYILRDEQVMRVNGETGELGAPIPGLIAIGPSGSGEPPPLELQVFIEAIQGFDGALDLALLDRYLEAGHHLPPGSLLHVHPPMCSREAAGGAQMTVTTVTARHRLDFLAEVACAVRRAGASRPELRTPVEPWGRDA